MRKARTNKKPFTKRGFNLLIISASLRLKHHQKHVLKLLLIGGFQSTKVSKSASSYLLKSLLCLFAYLFLEIGIHNECAIIRYCFYWIR